MTDATDLGEIVVVAKRPRKMTDIGYEQPEEVSENPDGGSAGTGGGFLTDEEVREEEKRQERCAAQEFRNRLQSISSRNSKESFSYILNREGNTSITSPSTADGPVITAAERSAVLNAYNIQSSEILGFAHNHPSSVYCNSQDLSTRGAEINLNAYPSENDLNWAQNFLGNNPNINPATFSLFVVGCDNIMRQFEYSRLAEWRQRVSQPNPAKPPAMQADCG